MSRAEEPGDLARQLDHVVHHVRQGHERRQAVRSGSPWLNAAPGRAGRCGRRPGVEVALAGGRPRARRSGRVVVRHRVVQAADDRQPVDHPAECGRCSQTWMPGTFVAIGRNSPRTSSGAPGSGPRCRDGWGRRSEDGDALADGGGAGAGEGKDAVNAPAVNRPARFSPPHQAADPEQPAAIEGEARRAARFTFPTHGLCLRRGESRRRGDEQGSPIPWSAGVCNESVTRLLCAYEALGPALAEVPTGCDFVFRRSRGPSSRP